MKKGIELKTTGAPYHDRIASSLKNIKENFGYALLWDAHSIPSKVPLLFDGELPELNFGTNDGRSCANDMIEAGDYRSRSRRWFFDGA